MSEVVEKFNVPSACRYNAKCSYTLPSALTDAYPDLLEPRKSEKFVWATHKLQSDLGLIADGKFGHGTYTAAIRKHDPIDSEYIINNGLRVHMPKSEYYKLVTFDEADGLDLHRFGNFNKRNQAISGICLHWGGLNPKHCYNVFASDSRQVSSHFLIGLEDDEPIVYQVLDIHHKAWHGGWVNDATIGIDICQSPTKTWKDHYEEAGYDIDEIKNESGRGPSRILSLDPRIADAAHHFVMDLLELLGWDFIAPEDHQVTKDIEGLTVFGHHHVNERKYDIAPWWDTVFGVEEDEEEHEDVV